LQKEKKKELHKQECTWKQLLGQPTQHPTRIRCRSHPKIYHSLEIDWLYPMIPLILEFISDGTYTASRPTGCNLIASSPTANSLIGSWCEIGFVRQTIFIIEVAKIVEIALFAINFKNWRVPFFINASSQQGFGKISLFGVVPRYHSGDLV
jgi:hypothetical protein